MSTERSDSPPNRIYQLKSVWGTRGLEVRDLIARNKVFQLPLGHTVVKLNVSAPGIREAGERFAELGAFGKWAVELRAACFGLLQNASKSDVIQAAAL